jgi:hypothetical protein
MSNQPQVFPFKANRQLALDIWHAWRNKNKEMLDRDHGRIGFCGDDTAKKWAAAGNGIYCGYGHLRSFSWYEVDMIIKSETEITFNVFGMADSMRGSRTYEPDNVFEVTVPKRGIKDEIHARKLRIAENEYERRLAEAAELAHKKAIQTVYNELFPETA